MITIGIVGYSCDLYLKKVLIDIGLFSDCNFVEINLDSLDPRVDYNSVQVFLVCFSNAITSDSTFDLIFERRSDVSIDFGIIFFAPESVGHISKKFFRRFDSHPLVSLVKHWSGLSKEIYILKKIAEEQYI